MTSRSLDRRDDALVPGWRPQYVPCVGSAECGKFPQIALENGIQGRVVLSFVIEKDGRLTNIQVLQTPDPFALGGGDPRAEQVAEMVAGQAAQPGCPCQSIRCRLISAYRTDAGLRIFYTRVSCFVEDTVA